MNVLLLVGGSVIVASLAALLWLARERALDQRERRAGSRRTVSGVVTSVEVAGRHGAWRTVTVAYRDDAGAEHIARARLSVGEVAQREIAAGTGLTVAYDPAAPGTGAVDADRPVRPTPRDVAATSVVLEALVIAASLAT